MLWLKKVTTITTTKTTTSRDRVVGADVVHERRQSDADGSLVCVLAAVPHLNEQSQLAVLTNPQHVPTRLVPTHSAGKVTVGRAESNGSLKARSDGSPVSERPRTTASVGALRPGLQCRHAVASAFRQPSPTCRTAFPAQHLRPSGVLGCWSDGLELTPGFYPGSNEQHRLFYASV